MDSFDNMDNTQRESGEDTLSPEAASQEETSAAAPEQPEAVGEAQQPQELQEPQEPQRPQEPQAPQEPQRPQENAGLFEERRFSHERPRGQYGEYCGQYNAPYNSPYPYPPQYNYRPTATNGYYELYRDSAPAQGQYSQQGQQGYYYGENMGMPQNAPYTQNGSYQNNSCQPNGGYQNNSYQPNGGYQNDNNYRNDNNYQNVNNYQQNAPYQQGMAFEQNQSYQQPRYEQPYTSYSRPRPAAVSAMPEPDFSESTVQKKKSNAGLIIICIISILLVCGTMIVLALNADSSPADTSKNDTSISSTFTDKIFPNANSVTVTIEAQSKPSTDPMDYQDMEKGLYTTTGAVKHVLPSIVNLYSYTSTSIAPSSGASGIIISEDGYIITNSHAVDDSVRIKVRLSDDREFEAKLIGMDTRTDLAVVKIEADDLVPAVIGKSSELEQGEMIIAIGNAGGLNNSVTVGYVSHPSRELKSYTGYPVSYVQTDAALNFGNSGGALINLYGQVVGIVNSKYSGSDGLENLGFAIASDFAVPICADIISKGYVTGRPRIGIMYQFIDTESAQKLEVEPGLLVSEISEDCDVANSGLQVDDIITEIDGEKMITQDSLRKFQETHKAGDIITVKVYRKSITGEVSEHEFSFKLEEDTEGVTTN